MQGQVAELKALLAPSVTALGYELLGVEYLPQGRYSLLRIYIDSEQGIGVDDCERVSHQVSGVLEVENPIRGQYTLEVSSPGLERPLFELAQCEPYVGERVRVVLKQPLQGRRKLTGTLQAVQHDGLVLLVEEETFQVSWQNVEKARLAPEY